MCALACLVKRLVTAHRDYSEDRKLDIEVLSIAMLHICSAVSILEKSQALGDLKSFRCSCLIPILSFLRFMSIGATATTQGDLQLYHW